MIIVAECPECGFPVFAHTATPTQDTIAFPTCDHVGGISAIDELPEYDPDRERATVAVLFNFFHNLRAIVTDYAFKFGELDEEDTGPVVIEAGGEVVA